MTPPEDLKNGIYTVSSGNFAKALAMSVQDSGITVSSIIHDRTADVKLQKFKELGGKVTTVTFDAWWDFLRNHGSENYHFDGHFIHPTHNRDICAGDSYFALNMVQVSKYGGGR